MKLFCTQQLWSPQILLVLIASFVLLAGGCSKTDPTAPANVPPVSTEDMIKSVEKDPRMPADVKAAEIKRIKRDAR